MTRWILFFLALILCSACSTPSRKADATLNSNASPPSGARQTPTTARADVVTATASEAQLQTGGMGEAAVRLQIADGYHVNANPPSDKFYIGTQLTVAAEAGIEPGTPAYPAAINKKFGFAPKPLAVYENDAVVRLPLRATTDAAKGKYNLRGKVRVQPCNDEACLPPRDVQLNIPVTIN